MLYVTQEDGQLNVADIFVRDYLLANADYINLPNVKHTGNGNDLIINMAGNDGGIANKIDLITHPAGDIVFETFKAGTFDLFFTSNNVNLVNMQVERLGSIQTPDHLVIIDNVNRRNYPDVSAQLVAVDRPFDLRFTDARQLFTNADIVFYEPSYLVNAFSTENSIERLGLKRDILVERTPDSFMQEPVLVIESLYPLREGTISVDGLIFYDPDRLLNLDDEQEIESREDISFVR